MKDKLKEIEDYTGPGLSISDLISRAMIHCGDTGSNPAVVINYNFNVFRLTYALNTFIREYFHIIERETCCHATIHLQFPLFQTNCLIYY